MQTVNDDILLRIIAVSFNEKAYGSFHPVDIRSHCKNYFEFIVGNFNNSLLRKESLEHYFNGTGDKFDEATKGVLDMLQQAKDLLEKDAASRKPKG